MQNVLRQWGCSEYIHKDSYVSLDLIIQCNLQKVYLEICSTRNEYKQIYSIFDDFIPNDREYDMWLLNPEWNGKLCIAFDKDNTSMVITCRNHN